MKFLEISEEEYRIFWENHPLKTFLSAPEIGTLREKSGWKKYFVGLKDNNELVGATMLVSHIRHFKKSEFYAPRGFLIDFNDTDKVNFFVEKIQKFIKSKGGYVLRVDPYVINKERDIDGKVVEGGINNTSILRELESLGFKKIPTNDMEQVGWMFSLGLDGKDVKTILKEMKPNTRNTIRKAEKFGIDVKEIGYDELDRFQNIMVETGERKNFSVRKLSYFQEMYKLFHEKGEVKYYITELDLYKYIKKLKVEIKEKEDKMGSLSDAKYNEGQKKGLTNEISSLNKRIEEAQKIIKEKNSNIITLSGSMFMLIKPEIIYLSSGNYEEFMKFNSQYLIQWMMIKYGIENGFKKHNFYGIPENIDTHPKDYGIYEFKRGFNGYVEELIGEFELPITWHYYFIKLLHKMRR